MTEVAGRHRRLLAHSLTFAVVLLAEVMPSAAPRTRSADLRVRRLPAGVHRARCDRRGPRCRGRPVRRQIASYASTPLYRRC
ncbi:hypothetical protein HBB16_20025 [Pseudonocardia sp. MCCB 268]|nr:hypothetical protein [Pseudonocardia cytotoxica]